LAQFAHDFSPRPTGFAAFPANRSRRLRRTAHVRNMVREHALTPQDLIYPVVVPEGESLRIPVGSMSGLERLTLDF
jgi:porphobilinogen synthase